MTLLQELKTLRSIPQEERRDSICHFISDSLGGQFIKLASRWPGRSGYLAYPVPHPELGPSEGYYAELSAGRMWACTAYGNARCDLLDWCIQELESQCIAELERGQELESESE
jgi:hypothetical protein